jgi:hypothetical protein
MDFTRNTLTNHGLQHLPSQMGLHSSKRMRYGLEGDVEYKLAAEASTRIVAKVRACTRAW